MYFGAVFRDGLPLGRSTNLLLLLLLLFHIHRPIDTRRWRKSDGPHLHLVPHIHLQSNHWIRRGATLLASTQHSLPWSCVETCPRVTVAAHDQHPLLLAMAWLLPCCSCGLDGGMDRWMDGGWMDGWLYCIHSKGPSGFFPLCSQSSALDFLEPSLAPLAAPTLLLSRARCWKR